MVLHSSPIWLLTHEAWLVGVIRIGGLQSPLHTHRSGPTFRVPQLDFGHRFPLTSRRLLPALSPRFIGLNIICVDANGLALLLWALYAMRRYYLRGIMPRIWRARSQKYRKTYE
jgi:hypothetical protein